MDQRQENECLYFQSSPWKEQGLDPHRVGVVSLRAYLQVLLDNHIERELPKVRVEIQKMIKDIENKIFHLGEDRPSLGHMRTFLSRLSMEFRNLTVSALNGTYHETESAFLVKTTMRHSRDGSVLWFIT